VSEAESMTPKRLAPDFIYKDECYALVGACFEVYKNKGCGFHKTNPQIYTDFTDLRDGRAGASHNVKKSVSICEICG
jgi:hypothetical protein